MIVTGRVVIFVQQKLGFTIHTLGAVRSTMRLLLLEEALCLGLFPFLLDPQRMMDCFPTPIWQRQIANR
jgi:hypothetical protein